MHLSSIFSRVDSPLVLHVIADALQVGENRVDLTPSDQFLQASVIPLSLGRKTNPHIHQQRDTSGPAALFTQESWVVMRGKIRARLFDVDQTLLLETDLSAGSLLITFQGGHALECLETGTVVLEFKNGPYLGRDFQTFSNP